MTGAIARRLSLAVASIVALGAVAIWLPNPALASVDAVYYFAGESTDQVNKLNDEPTATFVKEPPTGSSTITQDATGAVEDFVGNPFAAYWVGPYKGEIKGAVDICWFWSSTDPRAVAGPINMIVTFFADGTFGEVQADKVIGRETVPVSVGPPTSPTANVNTINVNGAVNQELMIQVHPTGGTGSAGNYTVHYGSTTRPSGFAPPGKTACAAQGSPSPTTTGSPSPSPSGPLPGTKANLGFNDTTPKRGATIKGTAKLGRCPGHEGTKIQLQRKKGDAFKKVGEKKLNDSCKAVFGVVADFEEAVFRAFWPKQDADHRASKSKPKTVTTH